MERKALAALAAFAAAALAACDGTSGALRLDAATPDHGPLTGGATITLSGAGFAAHGAGPVRVLIAGREAPLATAAGDATLQVVIPPGERPGDAEVIVLDDRGAARATGVFRYSAPPAIDAVAPGSVLATSEATRVAISGSGFLDEGAGEPTVAVGDRLATEVVVESDTRLSFLAPAGRAFAEPEIVVANQRGAAIRTRGLRYVPSMRPGLLLFPKFGGTFAVLYDPADESRVEIPWAIPPETRLTAVVRDGDGVYWGFDRNLRVGRLDLAAQRLEAPLQAGSLLAAAVRVNGEILGVDRFSLRFGRFDPRTGEFEQRGTAAIQCCGSYGLDASGGTLYLATRQGASVQIRTIDPATGAQGTPVTITGFPGFHVEEMRFFEGRLYATSRDGSLVVIDLVSATATRVQGFTGRHGAMEVFEPGVDR